MNNGNSISLEDRVLKQLREKGPQTVKELKDMLGADDLVLWRLCCKHPSIASSLVGKRYLRLDQNVNGYARLSPSIKREFLTYTVLSLVEDQDKRIARVAEMEKAKREISRDKIQLALDRLSFVVATLPFMEHILNEICFIIAGDVVYNMAHREPRPETSTGRMVNGSDLDVIVITNDGFPPELAKELDEAIYREKYQLLVLPNYREEIDYIVKDMDRVREQLTMAEFKHLVACKILHEGDYLYGSRALFDQIKNMVGESGVKQKMQGLEQEAIDFRISAEKELLESDEDLSEQECWKLFYTQAEQDEIF